MTTWVWLQARFCFFCFLLSSSSSSKVLLQIGKCSYWSVHKKESGYFSWEISKIFPRSSQEISKRPHCQYLPTDGKLASCEHCCCAKCCEVLGGDDFFLHFHHTLICILRSRCRARILVYAHHCHQRPPTAAMVNPFFIHYEFVMQLTSDVVSPVNTLQHSRQWQHSMQFSIRVYSITVPNQLANLHLCETSNNNQK